jgi:hypothetical protein
MGPLKPRPGRHLAWFTPSWERYSIGREDLRPVANRSNRMTWVYGEQLLGEFDISLIRFGGRASASIGSGARIIIRLAAAQ